MTDPYTTADLIAEAARQHQGLTEDPDFMGIGERMQSQEVTPGGGVAWDDFCEETFDAAQRAIDDLITGAADISDWAVQLGADNLEPATQELTWRAGEQPVVRVHFAFYTDISGEARDYLVSELSAALDQVMRSAAAAPADEPACGKCRTPFDATDRSFDGRARHNLTPYCRRCVDLCHDNEIADHRCVICA